MIKINELEMVYKNNQIPRTFDINECDPITGNTYLHIACCYYHYSNDNKFLQLIEWLIANNIAINATNITGDTSLHAACLLNNNTLTKLLIDHGANIEIANSFGVTPLYIACSNDNKEIINLLKNDYTINQEVDVVIPNPYGFELGEPYSLLALSCYYNNNIAAKNLIKLGVDVNQPNTYNNNSPLSIACANGNMEIAKLLLEKGANLNQADSDGKTPIALVNESTVFDETQKSNFINFLREINSKENQSNYESLDNDLWNVETISMDDSIFCDDSSSTNTRFSNTPLYDDTSETVSPPSARSVLKTSIPSENYSSKDAGKSM